MRLPYEDVPVPDIAKPSRDTAKSNGNSRKPGTKCTGDAFDSAPGNSHLLEEFVFVFVEHRDQDVWRDRLGQTLPQIVSVPPNMDAIQP
eukprot:1057664-Rhodomonas_salina.2